MNRIHRIVFNRSTGTCQAVCETATSHGGAASPAGTTSAVPARSGLVAALLVAGFGLGAGPMAAWADGGAGGDFVYFPGSGGAGGTAASPDGGSGTSYFDNGGGGGGGGVYRAGIQAGFGGQGGQGGGDAGFGPPGGAGGAGGVAGPAVGDGTLIVTVQGSAGGTGASAFLPSDGDGSASGGAGGGGGGSFAVVSTAAALNVGAALTGGAGGKGGNGDPAIKSGAIGGGGGGGEGGGGLLLTTASTVNNTSGIAGGAGGAGGNGGNGFEQDPVFASGGRGGDGGSGVEASGGASALTNDGVITGGAGGAGGTARTLQYNGLAGQGGAGITGANLTLTNSGTIAGGLSGDGLTRAAAVAFTGGVNRLTLLSSSIINGNVLGFSPADTLALGGTVAGTFDVSQIGDSAQYRGFGQYTKTGSGTWTLTGTTAALTPWQITAGTLAIGADGALGDAAGALEINNGGLQATANFSSNREVLLGNFGGIDTQGFNVSLSGKIGMGVLKYGELHKLGTGRLTLSNADSDYLGGTYIEAGTLAVSGLGKLGTYEVNVFSGATLDISQATTSATARYMFGNGTVATGSKTLVVDNSSSGTTFGGVIEDGGIAGGTGGKLRVSDAGGNWTLTSAQTYTGGTTLEAGNMFLSGSGALPVGGALALEGGILDVSGITAPGLTLGDFSGKSGTLALGTKVLTVGAAGNSSFSGTVSGKGSLIKVGTGTLTLAGANTYTGSTTVAVGQLQAGATDILSPLSALTVASGATFGLGNYSQTVGSLAGAGSVTMNSAALNVGGSNTDTTFSGVISGKGSLVKTGTGTLTLSGANTYTGGTTVSLGQLQAGANDILSPFRALTVASGATFGLASYDQTVGSLAGAGSVTLGSAALNVGGSDASTTFSGVISGKGSVIKSGTGTMTLAGDSTYTGATNVNGGTLLVNGNQAAATGLLTVASGATLGGSGTLGGAVTVLDGGHLAPGNSPGTLTTGTLTLNQTSQLDFEFGQAGTAGGTLNDLVSVNGNLVLDGQLNITEPAGGTFGPGFYRVFNYTGGLTDNTLEIASAPGAVVLSSLAIQTATPGQVNLVNSTGVTLQQWDPDQATAGVQGGAGVWQGAGGNNNWADANGAGNSPFANGAFAVFTGPGAAVTVDNTTHGPINVQGMQFDGDGYVLDGGTLQATTAETLVRVGAGSAGAGTTATINSVIADTNVAGGTTLVKSDPGTLVLGGVNTYRGGTAVRAGILQVSADNNLGDAAGGVTLDHGTLQVAGTAYSATARAIILDSGGGTVDIASPLNTFTVSQAVSGAGALTKTGTGTLVLASANTYAGGTAVNGGTLQTSITGALGSGPVAVNAGGGLMLGGNFNAGTLAIATAPAPGGPVNSGFVQLADNASAGSATIANQGTLELRNSASAGSSTIDNRGAGGTVFGDSSSAGNARITNAAGGQTIFWDSSSAGTARVTNEAGGLLDFFDNSTGAGATVVNQAGGTVRVSKMTTAGVAIGSLEGAGNVLLGNKALTLGGLGTDNTVSGTVSGTGGSLVKTGTGTLTLTGANTYTGGTTIAAGTLAGTAASFGTGAIVDNAALLINQTADATLANSLSGSGSLTKTGAGQLSYTGNGAAFTGNTLVSGGTLSVAGTLGGTTTIGSGATLKGNGTIGTTVLSAGATLAPGNSIGTLTVNGDFTFAPGSRYEVEANAAGQSDLLRVNGTATLGGAAVAVIAATGNYSLTTDYTILSASNRVGVFGGVSSNFAFLDPTLRYVGNDVLLTLRRNDVTFASMGATPNQRATAAAVQGLGRGTLYDAVVQLNAPTAQSAFNQLSGEIHASAKTAMLEDSRFVREAGLDRLRQSQGGAASGMSVQDQGAGSATWARVFGSKGHIDGDGNASRLNRDVAGFFVGADTSTASGWRAGGLLGYSKADLDIDGLRSTANTDSYHVGVYGGNQWSNTALRVGASYSWNKLETGRAVGFTGLADSLKGRYDASTTQVFGEVGQKMEMGTVALEPFAGLAYVNVDSKEWRESGGPAALHSGGGSTDSTFSTLGVRASTSLSEATKLRGTLGWRHAFGDRTPTSRNAFAAGQPFTVAGVPLAKDVAVVEAGVETQLQGNMTLGASYAGQFGDGLKDHGFKLTLGWKF